MSASSGCTNAGVPQARSARVGAHDRLGAVNIDQVAVVAHRGSSYDFPEHSLQAYVDAIEVGADALECDVRLSADGQLVCLHDATIDRTSAGRGRVASMTLAELRAVEWGPGVDGPLTLRELFELVADCGRRVELAVETKHPNRYAGHTEAVLCDLMDWFGWLPPGEIPVNSARFDEPSPVRVMSFSAEALRRVRERSPRTELVYLLEKPAAAALRPVLPAHAGRCGVDIALLSSHPDWIAGIVAAGHGLHVCRPWTPSKKLTPALPQAPRASSRIDRRWR